MHSTRDNQGAIEKEIAIGCRKHLHRTTTSSSSVCALSYGKSYLFMTHQFLTRYFMFVTTPMSFQYFESIFVVERFESSFHFVVVVIVVIVFVIAVTTVFVSVQPK